MKEVGDHEDTIVNMAAKLQNHLNFYIRMARMEHPELNEIFNTKDKQMEKIFANTNIKNELSEVFK